MCFSFDYKTKFVLKSRTRVAPVAPLAAAAMTRFTTWKKKKKELLLLPECRMFGWIKRRKSFSSPARPTGQQTHKTSRSFFWPLPLRDDDGGYRPFRLAAAPRAIPKKEKEKRDLCVVLFHRLCCDAIIHLTVSCSHFFSSGLIFFLCKRFFFGRCCWLAVLHL